MILQNEVKSKQKLLKQREKVTETQRIEHGKSMAELLDDIEEAQVALKQATTQAAML